MHSKCLLQIMRQTNSCLNQTMSSLCSALLCCALTSAGNATQCEPNRGRTSAPWGATAGWLPGWTLIPPISMAKGETGSDFRSGSAAAPAVVCSQFSAFSCLVFVFVFIFVFGFLFSVLFLLCCVFFSNFPRYLCKFFARRCVDDATCKGRGRWLRVYVSEIKISLSANCRPGLTFPLAVLWPTFRFFLSLSLHISFLRKRFSVCRKFFMV